MASSSATEMRLNIFIVYHGANHLYRSVDGYWTYYDDSTGNEDILSSGGELPVGLAQAWD